MVDTRHEQQHLQQQQQQNQQQEQEQQQLSECASTISTEGSINNFRPPLHIYLAEELEANYLLRLARKIREDAPRKNWNHPSRAIAHYYDHLKLIAIGLQVYSTFKYVAPVIHSLVGKEMATRILQKCIAIWKLRPALNRKLKHSKSGRFGSSFKRIFPGGDKRLFIETGYAYPLDEEQRPWRRGNMGNNVH